ncbi:MMPL family transporter [Chiayiivirga flava]|uniref:Putative exporter n=1 Tax=Chiayiivirga flava TaxID=659595 RepID=A0A7W8D2H1_9GAMM|nr:hypothetical protein [Chiayiivirga flava]MBB5206773.1 putative exporter [Chiayiivirga flava]
MPAPRHARPLAWLWLLLVAAVLAHQWHFWRSGNLQSDVLALLPVDDARPDVAAVGARIADQGARQVVIVLSSSDADATRRAAAVFAQALADAGTGLVPAASNADWFAEARGFFAPFRDRLLTAAQRESLATADTDALAAQALARLYGPLAGARLTPWSDDPLGLWPDWWAERAAGLDAGGDDLVRDADGRAWAVLRYELRDSAFRLDGVAHLQSAIDAAIRRADDGALRVLPLGVPLHAEAAAVQARSEVNTIGVGSLAAVLLLVWAAFGSLRPILLVALSLAVGMLAAVSATALVFGEVHLLTLVFGASLVGVAEDYGIHWFACRQGTQVPRWALLRSLLPGLSLALATSALAYLVLGVAPFPGLRQMALFSAVGLAAAFLTAVLWFPWLDHGPVRVTWLSRRIGRSLAAWPVLRPGVAGFAAAAVLAAVCVAGLLRLQVDDDLRSLQSSPQSLVDAQRDAVSVLRLPSPAQFFLVTGDTAEEVLQREEALTQRLRVAVADGTLAGWRAVSDWVPSRQRQRENAALSASVEGAVLARVAQQLDDDVPRPPRAIGTLEPEAWLASPASLPARALWQPDVDGAPASVVLLDGLAGPQAVAAVASLAYGLPGVEWIDRVGQMSSLLGEYRGTMSALLIAGHVLTFVLLLLRYGREAWRASLPTAIATALTVALLALLGQPLQLFTILGLLVLLGMGIDYGIFLLEHRGDPASWLAVCLGAASTWLAFGLLALSATPALRAFGLALLFGIGLVWLLSPLFRRRADESMPPVRSDGSHAY